MDEGSYIIKPKDPSAIVRLQDPTIIQELLEQPLSVLAESLAGYFSVGNGFWAAAGTRLAQAALKGRVFQQFEREFRYLREKGKIPDDFTKKKYRILIQNGLLTGRTWGDGSGINDGDGRLTPLAVYVRELNGEAPVRWEGDRRSS